MPAKVRQIYQMQLEVVFGLVLLSKLLLKTVSGSPLSESLMVIRDLGIQTCTQTIGGYEMKKFHDISRIRDFIINDHVTFYYVRQYCAFLVENESELVVPFKNCSRLRQLDLEYIYCSVKQILS